MLKVGIFTIFLLGGACEKTVQKPATTIANNTQVSEIKKSVTTQVELKPTGLLPLPEELRIETEKALNLDQKSAEVLAKTLEQEIKE